MPTRDVQRHMRITLIAGVLAGGLVASAQSQGLLLDDFGRSDGISALGTRWLAFTDRVMGGVSDQEVKLEAADGRRSLRLRGRVSLERNGGFIQVALPLASGGRPLDASTFTGVRLLVRGNGERYAIHLRTADMRLPWQYFEAEFDTGPDWALVELPFDRFVPQATRRALDASRLTRLGVVASKRAFEADVAVARLEFYARAR